MLSVSAVITSFNHLKYLPQAIESVRAQTSAPAEIIIIDDGSTDGTREFLNAELNKSQVKVMLNEQNLGTYASLNRAIHEAQGEWIAILNDDDLWIKTKLEQQNEWISNHPNAVLVGGLPQLIQADGTPTSTHPFGFEIPTDRSDLDWTDFIHRNPLIPSGCLFKKAVWQDLGGFDENYFGSGDWDFWFRISSQSPDQASSIGLVLEPLFQYRIHSQNASAQSHKIVQDDLRLRDRIIEFLSNQEASEVKSLLAFSWAAQGANYERAGDLRSACQAYRASLTYDPIRLKTIIRYLRTLAPGKR